MRELNYIDGTIEKNENPALRIGSVGRSALSTVYLMDCIEGMKQFPDKIFDLAVVDPPYGIDDKLYRSSYGNCVGSLTKYSNNRWDKQTPSKDYFDELFRVSKNQIIWGGNYFLDYLPNTRGVICWDKQKHVPNFSAWEMGWTSFDCVAKIFRQLNIDPKRIHPTQKPTKLYDWVFSEFASEGNLILDTHLGSQSSRIAANKAGLDFVGFEIDREYFDNGNKRFKNFVSQVVLF